GVLKPRGAKRAPQGLARFDFECAATTELGESCATCDGGSPARQWRGDHPGQGGIPMSRTTIALVSSLLWVLTLVFIPGPALADPLYHLLTTISVPSSPDNAQGGAFTTYDIAYFDGNTQLMYLADRSNASVDIFSAQTNS